MPGVIIPLEPSSPNYRVGVTLAGEQFILDVRWNTRESAWYLDVLQEDETPIRQGLKITLGLPIGGHVADAAWPGGYFYALDTERTGVDAGLDDMGERVQLYWFDSSEIEDTTESDPEYTLSDPPEYD